MLDVNPDGSVLKDGIPAHTWPNNNGYLTLKHRGKRHHVHRLVATKYIPNPSGYSDVNHKNGNKLDNRADNLEWCSRSQNIYHSLRNGLHARKEMPIRGTHLDTGEIIEFPSQSEAARCGFTQANIWKVLVGERPHHKRYRWEHV